MPSCTKPPSKTPRCIRGPGRSACRSIAGWKRTPRSRNSGAWRSSKSFFTGNSVSRQTSNSQTSEREGSMKRQLVTSMGSLSIVIAAALLAPASAAEQPGAVRGRADGNRDLRGVWDYRTITPMQRPPELENKEFFDSDEEAAAWERTENRLQNRDVEDEEGVGVHPPGWKGAGGGLA